MSYDRTDETEVSSDVQDELKQLKRYALLERYCEFTLK